MLLLRSRIFWAQFIVIFIVAAVNVVATQYDLYYYIWWLDIPQHLLGGAWLALTFVWLSLILKKYDPTFFQVFLSVLAIGIAWEIYEYVFGISYGPMYVYDTSKDLLMDCIGGITAYFLAQQFLLPPSAESETTS